MGVIENLCWKEKLSGLFFVMQTNLYPGPTLECRFILFLFFLCMDFLKAQQDSVHHHPGYKIVKYS